MTDNIRFLLGGNTLTNVELVNNGFDKRTKGFDKLSLALPLRVTDVGSKGKFGYISLENGYVIGIGFGMTGNIRIDPSDEQLAVRNETHADYMKHVCVAFYYMTSNGEKDVIYYHDVRRFGYVWYLDQTEFLKKIRALGPSILDDTVLQATEVSKAWRRKNMKNICDVLMNHQDLICGIGNYLKATILYECRIDPMVTVHDLSDEKLYELYLSARRWAQMAYEAGGASLYTYTGLHGDRTDFKLQLPTYDKSRCPAGYKVQRLETPDKRTTHWVPELQRPMVNVPKIKIRVKAKHADE